MTRAPRKISLRHNVALQRQRRAKAGILPQVRERKTRERGPHSPRVIKDEEAGRSGDAVPGIGMSIVKKYGAHIYRLVAGSS